MSIPRTNLDALQSFAVFADTLNFSEAARQLHISQPALHAKIRKLGEQLRLPLYVKNGRVLALTVEGAEVARHARELLALNQRFVRGMAAREERSEVSLAAGEGAYLYLLGRALARFRVAARAAALNLLTADRETAMEAVRSGRAQLGVAPLGEAAAAFQARPLTSVGQVVVMPRDHPLAKRRKLKLADLEGTRLIVPSAGRPHRELLARLLAAEGVSWEVALEANGWALMLQFAAWRLGLTVVNACCPPPKGMVGIPLQGYPSLTYHVFHARDRALDATATRLFQVITEQAEQWRTDLALPAWR